ncbi:hypothetical protein KEM55_007491 [Ascosphaera atra]|nr:hypothetical protein KEM55_007491 [Ascosphaera atra]
MKYYLNNTNKEAFMFEPGRQYKADFGNSYLGFSDFTLRLPGFRVTVTDYIDEKNHELRYVLKNKKTGELYFSLRFELLLQGQEEFKPAPGVQASSSEDTKEKDNQEKAEQKDENKDERKDEQDEDEVD